MISEITQRSEFFGKLMQIRTQAHLRHLNPTNPGKTGSFAEHIALEEFYKSIVDLADSLIESYQGKYGLVKISSPPDELPADVKLMLKSFCQLTESGAYNIFDESWIKNQLDEMSQLTYSTLFKLENLA